MMLRDLRLVGEVARSFIPASLLSNQRNGLEHLQCENAGAKQLLGAPVFFGVGADLSAPHCILSFTEHTFSDILFYDSMVGFF